MYAIYSEAASLVLHVSRCRGCYCRHSTSFMETGGGSAPVRVFHLHPFKDITSSMHHLRSIEVLYILSALGIFVGEYCTTYRVLALDHSSNLLNLLG